MLKTIEYLISIPFILTIGYIFFNYLPWLINREPIEMISQYELSNLPPPEGAVSFSINHGQAIYYFEKTPLELTIVLIALIISITVLGIMVLIPTKK